MLSWSQTWSQTCSELEFGLSRLSSSLARASRSATSFGPVCDQESVMEFGLNWTLWRHATKYSNMSSTRGVCLCIQKAALVPALFNWTNLRSYGFLAWWPICTHCVISFNAIVKALRTISSQFSHIRFINKTINLWFIFYKVADLQTLRTVHSAGKP